MRVATKTMYDLVKYNLAHISEEMNQANRVVSSGKRINELSDDPVGLTQALKIESTLSNVDQLGRNISMGKSWLSAAEGALGHTQDLLSDVRALCVQMGSSTAGTDQRQSASLEVQNIFDEIVSLANTQIGGRYIFAGSKTDAAAFASDGTYNGDDNPFSIKNGQNSTIEVGSDGGDLFSQIFNTLTTLKNDLQNNDGAGILAALDGLQTNFDDTGNKISDIGSKVVRMEIKENIFNDLKITNTDRLSQIEDADITEAIIELQQKELAYKAALASSSTVMKLSLVDYIE